MSEGREGGEVPGEERGGEEEGWRAGEEDTGREGEGRGQRFDVHIPHLAPNLCCLAFST